jgi:hypothetical protein
MASKPTILIFWMMIVLVLLILQGFSWHSFHLGDRVLLAPIGALWMLSKSIFKIDGGSDRD